MNSHQTCTFGQYDSQFFREVLRNYEMPCDHCGHRASNPKFDGDEFTVDPDGVEVPMMLCNDCAVFLAKNDIRSGDLVKFTLPAKELYADAYRTGQVSRIRRCSVSLAYVLWKGSRRPQKVNLIHLERTGPEVASVIRRAYGDFPGE